MQYAYPSLFTPHFKKALPHSTHLPYNLFAQ